jgi:uncharacterized protein (TIGR02145 family)
MTNKSRIWIYPLAVMSLLLVLTNSCKKSNNIIPPETVTDSDGNVYHTITIGSQVWMLENLKTTKYSNGDPISNVTDQSTWANLTRGAYCDHNNDPNFSETYGKLYNWHAVNDTRKIAPAGWHIPSDAEWTTLINSLGGLTAAGGKLKESGLIHWPNPNTGASNSSGFTALPGGYRDDLGEFNPLASGYWWSSTANGLSGAWSWNLSYISAGVVRADAAQSYGYTVRCIMD